MKRLMPERRLAQRFAPVPAKLKIACETGASLPFAGEDAETQRDSPGTREVPGLIWNSECVASDAFSFGSGRLLTRLLARHRYPPCCSQSDGS